MRKTIFRLTTFGIALGSLVFAQGLIASQLNAQVVVVGQAAKPAPPDAKDKAKAESVDFMTFPNDRDAKQLLQAVIDYLKGTQGNEKWEQICTAAQRVLDTKTDSFYDYSVTDADGTKRTNRISVKVKANELISSFPPAGKQFYQLAYGPTAQFSLDDAIRDGYDRNKIADVSQRYFHTKAGAQATVLLASLQLDRGSYSEAAYSFERLLNRPGNEEWITPRTLLKAVIAFKRSGDTRYAESEKTRLAELEKKFPRDGLLIGKRTYDFNELKQELDRPVDTLYGKLSESFVAMRMGNASRTGIFEAGTPFLDPTFSVPMLYRVGPEHQKPNDWIRQNLEGTLRQIVMAKKQPPIPGTFPITAGGLVLFRAYDGVYAVVAKDGFAAHGKAYKAGELFWISFSERGLYDLVKKDTINPWWQFYQQNNMSSILYDNPLIGSLSHDGKSTYFIDDMAIPQPPNSVNPEFGVNPNANVPNEFIGIAKNNLLVSVNIEMGKQDWVIGGQNLVTMTDEEEDKASNPHTLMSGCYFMGPPLPLNGKLYVLFERNGRIRLACLDPNKISYTEDPNPKNFTQEVNAKPVPSTAKGPAIVWQQKLGEPLTRMDIDSIRRMQCAYMAYSDGVLVCPTNSGAYVGVDIMSRSLLWAHSYKTRELPKTDLEQPPNAGRLGGRIIRGGGMGADGTGMETSLRSDRWRAATPIISKGRVIVTAYDSNLIECIDLRTGSKIWKDNRAKSDLYVAGVIDDKVVIIGEDSARAYNLMSPAGQKDPTLAWKNVKIALPSGHGAAGKNGVYYIPTANAPETNQPEVWALDIANGKVISRTAFRKKGVAPGEDLAPLGNLIFHDGQVYSQTPRELVAFPLSELKRKAMDETLAKNPTDPTGLSVRGELLLDDGKLKEAIADFKKAEANTPPEFLRKKIKEKLYYAYTQLLKDDFNANQSIIEEYKTLTEFSIDSDDPNEKQRLFDEQIRRRGLYLCLMAKGREKQGRLAEAFDFYRAFATLGDNKQLVAIYDEPGTQSRPDVWARGRIDRMIREAKDPVTRKPLEARVEKEWQEVKATNDLPRLRTFVQVFGPYFNAGQQAQLLLADRLLATQNEDDLKEAESYLHQTMAASDDRTQAATATETLARLMIRKRLFEDAIGLYTRLGVLYADVKIRDGKTGNDFFAELLTDRRLLPYLEPHRLALPTKVKIEHRDGANNRAVSNGFLVEPEGELLPFYKRFKLMVDFNSSGNGMWTLIVSDKTTGTERCRFSNLSPFNNPYGQNWSDIKLAQANGHLLLLNLGHISYCFDLSEKKELWRYNLLGAIAPNPNFQPQTEMTTTGEMVITYEDGWKLRLGRASILQPGYAALLTRDGLVALDPNTGVKMWAKADVSAKSQLFGDAKHLYLIETTANEKHTSRVLRAVDGASVPNVPAFGELIAGPGRIRMVGRLALIHETDKKADGGTTTGAKIIGKVFGTGAVDSAKEAAEAKLGKILRLYDPLTGTDIWKKNYEPGSILLKTFDSSITGQIRLDGRFEVVEVSNGKVLFQGQIDKDKIDEHVKGLADATLLADADRYYVVLNNNRQNKNRMNYYYGYNPIRWLNINGPMYCFDKSNSKRLWILDRQFESLAIVIDRFEEMPVIVAANYTQEENNGTQTYRVAVVDKSQGKLRFARNLDPNGPFQNMVSDPKTGRTEFIRYNSKLSIIPDDGAAEATKVEPVKQPVPTQKK